MAPCKSIMSRLAAGLLMPVTIGLCGGWIHTLPGKDAVAAFPQAQGFGATTPGGRGGGALMVNNLNDSGPGSLRAACEAKGARIVVFRVAGLIDLKSPIRIREPFVTIAGQSAPGDGVCLRGYGLIIDAHDVVVRFLRSRPGDIAGAELDGLSVGGNSRNVVIDHCSVSWATDENLSPSGGVADLTLQWCLVAEALNHSVHSKGPHGYGSLVRAVGGVTLHHNLWAHNQGRNPRLGDNYAKPPFPTFDVRNNVIYDLGSSSVTGDTLNANYIGNYIKPGPSSKKVDSVMRMTDTGNARFHGYGNIVEGRPEKSGGILSLFERLEFNGRKLVEEASQPFAAPEVQTSSAQDAYEQVLRHAGAIAPVRDAVDERIIAQVRQGKGSVIDSQWEVGGWPPYRGARPPVDSDRDGMPDEWERAHGLNPADPSDAVKDRNGDGITNIEEYLNSLAAAARRADT